MKSNLVTTASLAPALTEEEITAAREYRNELARSWWGKQSPEERRERRRRYASNAAKKRAELSRNMQGTQKKM